MRALVALVVLAAVAACGGDAPPNPMPRPIALIEQRIREPFRGVAIAADGLYFFHKKLSVLADFERVRPELVAQLTKLRATQPSPTSPGIRDAASVAMSVVIVLDPAITPPLVTSVLAAVAAAGWQNVNVKTIDPTDEPDHPSLKPVCKLIGQRSQEPDPPGVVRLSYPSVQLSVLVNADRTWVGLSQVNEFYDLPVLAPNQHDYEKLRQVLKEHKASAFFADRLDAELAVGSGISTEVLLTALELTCDVGFTEVRVLDPAKLTATPRL